MRLDVIREHEIARRKGLAKRTAFAVLWLVVGLILGYLLATLLVHTGTLKADVLFSQLSWSTEIGETVLKIGFTLIVVLILQFFVVIGFALTSPEARKKSGMPTAVAQDPDPFRPSQTYH